MILLAYAVDHAVINNIPPADKANQINGLKLYVPEGTTKGELMVALFHSTSSALWRKICESYRACVQAPKSKSIVTEADESLYADPQATGVIDEPDYLPVWLAAPTEANDQRRKQSRGLKQGAEYDRLIRYMRVSPLLALCTQHNVAAAQSSKFLANYPIAPRELADANIVIPCLALREPARRADMAELTAAAVNSCKSGDLATLIAFAGLASLSSAHLAPVSSHCPDKFYLVNSGTHEDEVLRDYMAAIKDYAFITATIPALGKLTIKPKTVKRLTENWDSENVFRVRLANSIGKGGGRGVKDGSRSPIRVLDEFSFGAVEELWSEMQRQRVHLLF
ncbi:hypothetical protein H9P43_009143 [Blastocladiella emersonii ATCC 22665]|nr:hypothetical protein H9P43_009143 [Blastocladiella emersonii ATCC 22665]